MMNSCFCGLSSSCPTCSMKSRAYKHSSQVIFFAIAFKITSCSFIIRSSSAAEIAWLVSKPWRLQPLSFQADIYPDNDTTHAPRWTIPDVGVRIQTSAIRSESCPFGASESLPRSRERPPKEQVNEFSTISYPRLTSAKESTTGGDRKATTATGQ